MPRLYYILSDDTTVIQVEWVTQIGLLHCGLAENQEQPTVLLVQYIIHKAIMTLISLLGSLYFWTSSCEFYVCRI